MKNIDQKFEELLNLYKLKRFTQAEEESKNLINLYPKNVWLYNFLGVILTEQKKLSKAMQYLEKGIKIDSEYPMLYNNLGSIYKLKNRFQEAEENFLKSIDLDKKNPEPKNNLGNLYRLLNKDIKALEYYKKSVKDKPNFFPGYYNLGITYKNIGNFKEAKINFKKAISLNNALFTAHRNLSEITSYSSSNKHLNLLKKIYKNKSININKKEIAFALGKAYEDLKNYKESFKFYNEGNKLHRKTIQYTIEREINEFKKIKEVFNKKFYGKYFQYGLNSKVPIFIVGMPRSGTTLVEQILSSHPEVFGADELNYMPILFKKYFGNYINNNIFDNVNKNNNNIFSNLGNEYLNFINKISKNSCRVTDKLPINFKYVGLIKIVFPNAKIVHCTRNAKDICFSIFKNYFVNPDLNYAYDMNEIINYYKLYSDLMKYWQKLFPNFLINADYEKIIENPNTEIKKLIKSCNLIWNDKCLKFYNNKRIIKTASDTQVRKKIYKTSKNSWKRYEKYINKLNF